MGIRAFLAIPVSAEVIAESGRIIQQLTPCGGGDVKWVDPQQLHLTLKFFGDVTHEATSDICRRVQEAIDSCPAFVAEVLGVGAFPALQRPRTIWAGVDHGADRLVILAGRMEKSLETLGYPRERRQFKPHLTLGRVKGRGPFRELAAKIGQLQSHPFGWMEVTEVVLFRSELSRRVRPTSGWRRFPSGRGLPPNPTDSVDSFGAAGRLAGGSSARVASPQNHSANRPYQIPDTPPPAARRFFFGRDLRCHPPGEE